MKEQIFIYFIQTDKTFNRERVEKMLETLIDRKDIVEKDGIIRLATVKDINENVIDAFWVFLHYADEDTPFNQGSYPSEIIFKKDDEVAEIVIMDDDAPIKMDYLSKRKYRKNKSRYIFAFTSGTIDEFDDELFPTVAVTLVTMSPGKDTPKLVYHEVENE